MPAVIALTGRNGHGHAALVDAADFDWLNQWRWQFASGYAVRSTWRNGKRVMYRMHREILGLRFDDGLEADHINLDRLDNRRENLRIVTPAQNKQNTRSRPRGRSRFRGVYWHAANQKWVAQVRLNGKSNYLGSFSDEAEAAGAAARFREEHMPFALNSRGGQ